MASEKIVELKELSARLQIELDEARDEIESLRVKAKAAQICALARSHFGEQLLEEHYIEVRRRERGSGALSTHSKN